MVKWEKVKTTKPGDLNRAKVPGGWLLFLYGTIPAITFYPDPSHEWKGDSLT